MMSPDGPIPLALVATAPGKSIVVKCAPLNRNPCWPPTPSTKRPTISPRGLMPSATVCRAIPFGQLVGGAALQGTSIGVKLNDCASQRAVSNGSEQPIVKSAILSCLLMFFSPWAAAEMRLSDAAGTAAQNSVYPIDDRPGASINAGCTFAEFPMNE